MSRSRSIGSPRNINGLNINVASFTIFSLILFNLAIMIQVNQKGVGNNGTGKTLRVDGVGVLIPSRLRRGGVANATSGDRVGPFRASQFAQLAHNHSVTMRPSDQLRGNRLKQTDQLIVNDTGCATRMEAGTSGHNSGRIIIVMLSSHNGSTITHCKSIHCCNDKALSYPSVLGGSVVGCDASMYAS